MADGPSKHRGIRVYVVDKIRRGLWFFNSIDGSTVEDFQGKVVKIVDVQPYKPTYIVAVKIGKRIVRARIDGSNLRPIGDIVSMLGRPKTKELWKTEQDQYPRLKTRGKEVEVL